MTQEGVGLTAGARWTGGSRARKGYRPTEGHRPTEGAEAQESAEAPGTRPTEGARPISPVRLRRRFGIGAGGSAGDDRPVWDAGRATIEVVFLAVLLLIPTVYILISVFRVQAATFAVTQAARDAGRLLDAADTIDIGLARAREAAAVALTDQSVPPDGLTIRFASPGADCHNGVPTPPPLAAGTMVDVCVTAVLSLPGVPSVLTGSRNTVTGVFTLHVGEFREHR